MTGPDTTPKEVRTVIIGASKDLFKAAYIFTLPLRLADSNLPETALVNHTSRRFGRRRRHPVVGQYVQRLQKHSDTEQEAGFPTIATLAIGHLWSFLESFSRDLVAAWLKDSVQFDPSLLRRLHKEDAKLQDEASWQDDEMDYWQFLSNYLRDRSGHRKYHGLERFERWFALIGLEGSQNASYLGHRHGQRIICDLTELHQIRNCLFHHRGLLDRRARDNCPWLGLEIGSSLQLTMEMATRYYLSTVVYLLLIRNRIAERFDPANWFTPEEFWSVCNLDDESWLTNIATLLLQPVDPAFTKRVSDALIQAST